MAERKTGGDVPQDVADALRAEAEGSMFEATHGTHDLGGFVMVFLSEPVTLGGGFGGMTLERTTYAARFVPGDRGEQNPDVLRVTGITGNMALETEPIEAGDGHRLTLSELIAWSAYGKAIRGGNEDLAGRIISTVYEPTDRQPQSRPRRRTIRNLQTILTNTKPEKAVFGDVSPDKVITAESYDGRHEIPIGMGKLRTDTTLMLMDGNLDLATIPANDLALSYLNDRQRYWLSQLQSVVNDNPGLSSVFGTEVLMKAGHSKPLRPEMAGTMREAAEAITTCTQVTLWIDSTGESKGYRDRRVVRSVTARRFVEGSVSLLEYEDGSVDFRVDFDANDGTHLPWLDYARDKHELMEVPSEFFKFPFKTCGTVTTEHRRMMTYIYRQAAAKGLSDTILFSTMFQRMGLKDTKDSRYRARRKLERLLDDWQRRSPKIVRSWSWKRDGRAITGVTVHLNKSYTEQLEAQNERNEYARNHPRPSGRR